ncbi:gamma-glutamyl-gamma-aminobutyrate hydrolase family protein [Paenibacillus eucommiae]|uniref:Glutamine amidotransferase n=1 Tax=Paenibacillus eucommiae TaxID=1355755 RepID=A0ABS4IU06_9BACL|nr:gamma-glutamyl-gamma-aminobutyrate hydrolase family protein [Paenibacillus eucommiae]MBP1991071.1 putative glutamine amidotransferase [Paenibacillus eucommiae]
MEMPEGVYGLRPIIGITSNISEERLLTTGLSNIQAIVKGGGVPIVLPNLADESSIEQLAASIDGLLVTGGNDADPALYGEEPHPNLGEVCPERDYFETTLIAKFLEKNKPILGICRGCQMINITAGGELFQDIYAQIDKPLLQHTQKAPRSHPSHFVEVKANSLLYEAVQSTRFKVNSFHHQAVKRIADGFEVSALASDGIIEGYESKLHRFVLAVQWHPENLAQKDDEFSLKLFRRFIQACQQGSETI